jgi:hypothetical protein
MSETQDTGTRVLPSDGSGSDPAVVMDSSSTAGDVEDMSVLAENHGSWLLDFLLDGNRGGYNTI